MHARGNECRRAKRSDEEGCAVSDQSEDFAAMFEASVQAKRLDAVPWARHCIECQEKQDQGLLVD